MSNFINPDEPTEVDVIVREKLVKRTCIFSTDGHMEYDREYDALSGGYTNNASYVAGNLVEDYKNQSRTLQECLKDCCKVIEQLIKEKRFSVAKVYLRTLLDDCSDWETEEVSVVEG